MTALKPANYIYNYIYMNYIVYIMCKHVPTNWKRNKNQLIKTSGIFINYCMSFSIFHNQIWCFNSLMDFSHGSAELYAFTQEG